MWYLTAHAERKLIQCIVLTKNISQKIKEKIKLNYKHTYAPLWFLLLLNNENKATTFHNEILPKKSINKLWIFIQPKKQICSWSSVSVWCQIRNNWTFGKPCVCVRERIEKPLRAVQILKPRDGCCFAYFTGCAQKSAVFHWSWKTKSNRDTSPHTPL